MIRRGSVLYTYRKDILTANHTFIATKMANHKQHPTQQLLDYHKYLRTLHDPQNSVNLDKKPNMRSQQTTQI